VSPFQPFDMLPFPANQFVIAAATYYPELQADYGRLIGKAVKEVILAYFKVLFRQYYFEKSVSRVFVMKLPCLFV
jgi:hypothetical protein